MSLAFILALLPGCNVFPLSPNPPKRAETETIPGLQQVRVRVRSSSFSRFRDRRSHPLLKELSACATGHERTETADDEPGDLRLPSRTGTISQLAGEVPRPATAAFFHFSSRGIWANEKTCSFYTFWGTASHGDCAELTHAILHSVSGRTLWLTRGCGFSRSPAGWKAISTCCATPSAGEAEVERLSSSPRSIRWPGEPRAWARRTGCCATIRQGAWRIFRKCANPNPGPLGPRLAHAAPKWRVRRHRRWIDAQPAK